MNSYIWIVSFFILTNFSALSQYALSQLQVCIVWPNKMKDSTPLEHSITIEEAINLTSGTFKYQKRMMVIIILGLTTICLALRVSTMIMGLGQECSYGTIIGSLLPWLTNRYGRKKSENTAA